MLEKPQFGGGEQLRAHVRGQQAALEEAQSEVITGTGQEGLPTPEQARKSVTCFVGMPGAGKSTQIERLRSYTGAPTFHLSKVAKSLPLELEVDGKSRPVAELLEEQRKKGELLSGLDDIFLKQVADSPEPNVILDGFPRSPEQAEHLVAAARQNNWAVHVIHLASDVKHAWHHQIKRAKNTGTKPDIERFDGKINRAIKKDIPAIGALASAGVPVSRIEAEDDKEKIAGEIRESLGLDFEQLPWERNILEYGQRASKETGVELWFGAGMLYRPFWNGSLGPVQESTDKDIFVLEPEDVPRVQAALETIAPHVRWSVHSRKQESLQHFGAASDSLEDGILQAPINFRQGGVRLKQDGKVEVLLPPQVESGLRRGVVRLDEQVLARLPEGKREEYLDGAVRRISKTLLEYPGLRVEGLLAELLEKKNGAKYQAKEIVTGWETIQDAVWEKEYGGRAVWNPDSITPEQEGLMREVVEFYRTVDKKASAPPRPVKSKLPAPLEAVRGSSESPAIPEGYHSWLEYVSKQGTDAEFREWLLNQTRSRTPVGGKDKELADVLSFVDENEQRQLAIQKQEQKATHLGFTLGKHLVEATLQLSTDQIVDELAAKYPELAGKKNSLRVSLRIAMLFHDFGKLHNVDTPGSHENIGAKMWLRLRPSWVTEEEANLAAWVIRTHDVFGRLARSITEKPGTKVSDPNFDVRAMPAYQGAVDPSEAAHLIGESGLPFPLALDIHKASWQGDVSSVSALRWVLPVADNLAKMVEQARGVAA